MKIHSYHNIIDIYLTPHDALEIMTCHHSLPPISSETHEPLSLTHQLTIDNSFFLFRSSLLFPVNEITLCVGTTSFRIQRSIFKNKSVCCGVDLTTETKHFETPQHSHYSQVIYIRDEKKNNDVDSIVHVSWPYTTDNKYIGHHFLYRFGIFSKCVVFLTRVQTLPLWNIHYVEQSTEPYHTYNGIFYTHSSVVKTIFPSITDKNDNIVPITMFRPIGDSPPQDPSRNRREIITFVLVMTVAVILFVLCLTLFYVHIKQ